MSKSESQKVSYKATIWIVVVGFPLHLLWMTMIAPGQADPILICLLLGFTAINVYYLAANPSVFRAEGEFREVAKTGRNAIILPGIFRFVEMVARPLQSGENLRWMTYVDAILCFLGALYLWKRISIVGRRNAQDR